MNMLAQKISYSNIFWNNYKQKYYGSCYAFSDYDLNDFFNTALSQTLHIITENQNNLSEYYLE